MRHGVKSTKVADSVLAFSAGVVIGRILGAHIEFHLTERTGGHACFRSNLGHFHGFWRLCWSFLYFGWC